jgi:hypothetical protein
LIGGTVWPGATFTQAARTRAATANEITRCIAPSYSTRDPRRHRFSTACSTATRTMRPCRPMLLRISLDCM